MLPRFVVALPQDSLLQSSPPFDFPNVSMRIFPIRADMTRVQSLVDGWLNSILPPEVGYFRVFSPFVALVALNYGRAAVIPANLGWSSQHEVTFSVPLQWYRLGDRGFEFHDFAVLSPYIFVDNELSVPAGREVFGWQKVLIWPDPLVNRWMANPRAPVKHAGMETLAFRQVYAGKQQQRIPFVQIEEGPAGAWLQYPPDRQNPHLPWVALHNAVDTVTETTQDLLDLLAGLGLTRRRRAPLPGGRSTWLDPDPGSLRSMLRVVRGLADPYSANLYANEINLKQFRDAERPTVACYQEVNNTVMRVQEINRAGFLGEARVLAGDVTGGYRITLHQWESLPIAEMLGLEGKRSSGPDGGSVSAIKPVFPMWADMDLGYAEERRVLAWRSEDRGWVFGEGSAASRAGRAAQAKGADGRGAIPYNTALGASSPVIYGPFETPAMTVRALPLLASRERLRELCDLALNEPLRDMDGAGEGGRAGFSFEPWGSYVYLLINTSDSTYSVSNNIGSWPSAAASFAIPVRCRRDGAPDGFALYCPFAFSASSLDTMAGSELNGTRVMSAKIDSPSSTWMEDCGPADGHARTFAVISAMIPPILNAGERAEMRALIRVDLRSTDPLHADTREVEVSWPIAIKADLKRRPPLVPRPSAEARGPSGRAAPSIAPPRDGRASPPAEPRPSFEDLTLARARAIDFLAEEKAIRFVSLKQFRDVARPDRACYQALVEVEQRLLSVDRIEEIRYPLDVSIVEYESMPLVRMLGLVPRSVRHEGGLRVHVLEPIRPFWGRAHHREELGKNLAVQERDLVWARRDGGRALSLEARRRSAEAEAARDGERLSNLRRIDLGEPRGLARAVALRRGGAEQPAGEPAAPSPAIALPRDADAALARIEPQWVLESLLSREWESHARTVWQRRRHQISERLYRETRHHSAFTERTRTRLAVFLEERGKIEGRGHADLLEEIDARLLPRFTMLSWVLSEARHLDEIAHSSLLDPEAHANDPQGALSQARRFYAKDELSKLGRALEERHRGLMAHVDALVVTDPALLRIVDAAIAMVGGPAAAVLAEAHRRFVQTREVDVAVLGPALAQLFGGAIMLPEGLVEDLREARSLTISRFVVYLAWFSTNAGGKTEQKRVWTAFLRDLMREVNDARDELTLALAKCAQKPFFCVRRDTAGSGEVEGVMFPKEDCWRDGDDYWYSLPLPAEEEEQEERGPASGPIFELD